MSKNNGNSLTSKNLDRLTDLLNRELDSETFNSQIPNGAHIFHGSYNDTELTQGNLKLASKILLGMTLGYIKEAPLIMLYERDPDKQLVLNLSEILEKEGAQAFIGRFQKQNQKKVAAKLNQILAA